MGVVGARGGMELVQDLGGLGERRTGSRRWFSDDSKKEEKPVGRWDACAILSWPFLCVFFRA